MPEKLNSNPVLQAEIAKRSIAKPFKKFMIATSSGRSYKVMRVRNLTITGLHKVIIVENDNGTSDHIEPEEVTAVKKLGAA